MNKLLSMVVLVPSVILGAEGVKVSRAAILAAADLGRISVRCSDEGFQVKGPGGVQLVERGDTDETLRRVNPNNLAAFMKAGKVLVSKTNDGKYILRSHINGLGGGVWGAYLGATAMKLLISGAGHGTLLAVSFLAGPGQSAALLALEATFGAGIEIAANTAAVAGGMAAAVATGPV